MEGFHHEGEMRGRVWPWSREGCKHKLKQPLEKTCKHLVYPVRDVLTKGGDKYSNPTLFARFTLLSISFTRLYLSTLKLNVGPPGNLMTLNDGATSVNVNARRCVT